MPAPARPRAVPLERSRALVRRGWPEVALLLAAVLWWPVGFSGVTPGCTCRCGPSTATSCCSGRRLRLPRSRCSCAPRGRGSRSCWCSADSAGCCRHPRSTPTPTSGRRWSSCWPWPPSLGIVLGRPRLQGAAGRGHGPGRGGRAVAGHLAARAAAGRGARPAVRRRHLAAGRADAASAWRGSW